MVPMQAQGVGLSVEGEVGEELSAEEGEAFALECSERACDQQGGRMHPLVRTPFEGTHSSASASFEGAAGGLHIVVGTKDD